MNDILVKIITKLEQINTIPRCSGNEVKIRLWMTDWAEKKGFEYQSDEAGNLVVRIPPTRGYEKSPSVAIQGHMDMVCEKRPEATHDFSRDPISLVQKGDWLSAKDTSLGADNGIALAYAMVLAEETALPHPPLELLFTVDEENGLVGANLLGADMLSSRFLINLDSEVEGEFIIGCAGGMETVITLDLDTSELTETVAPISITVGGLLGGHSGVDIHKHRANAIKLLARTLRHLAVEEPFRISEIHGGTRHNALARSADALVIVPAETANHVVERVGGLAEIFRSEFGSDEPDLFCDCHIGDSMPTQMIDHADSMRIVNLLSALPHGVMRMSPFNSGTVETSTSLALVTVSDNKLVITTSQRSSSPTRLEEITDTIHAVAGLAGAGAANENQYPPWPPKAQSPLVEKAEAVYRRLSGHSPNIAVIHAGLECAVIGKRFPGIEMISFGPTIESPHSPMERLYLPSVEKVWHLLTSLLAEMRE